MIQSKEDKNIDLTPEEEAEIEKTFPAVLDGLKAGKSHARAWLIRWRQRRNNVEYDDYLDKNLEKNTIESIKAMLEKQNILIEIQNEILSKGFFYLVLISIANHINSPSIYKKFNESSLEFIKFFKR